MQGVPFLLRLFSQQKKSVTLGKVATNSPYEGRKVLRVVGIGILFGDVIK